MGAHNKYKMGLKDELVVASDPQEDVEDEEEEEEDLVDPQETLKENCMADSHCQAYQAEFERCNERVEARENTEETCAQELYDFMHCVDHCVSKSLFTKLK